MSAPSGRRRHRAQANLVVVAVALLVLTTVTGMSVVLADGALAREDRRPVERHVAATLADRLVAPETNLAERRNVLARSAVESLSAHDLYRLAPATRTRAVQVRLDDRTLVETGDVTGGTTLRRVVLVAEPTPVTHSVNLTDAETATLPRRTPRVDLTFRPGPGTRIQTVRADGRVVLHAATPAGLRGRATVRASRYETTTLSFDVDRPARGNANRPQPVGTVTVTTYPRRTTKAVLAVTVRG